MVRRALALMVAVAVVGAVVGMVGVLGPRPVEAQPTATRSFSADTVAPGGQLMVTVEVGGYGAFGGLTEMLPEGFTYVSSSPSTTPEADGRLIFVLSGEMEVTYTVAAPFTPSMYTFTGTVTKVSLSEQVPDEDEPVIGDTVVTVELDPSPEPTPSFSATRSFNPASVAPGDPVEVTIMARGYGSFGQVVETLPAEFSYVSSSLGEDAEESGLVATFTLLEDPKTFTYTVTAPSTSGRYTFRGIVDNSDFERKTFDSRITVGTPPTTPTPRPIRTSRGGGGGGGGGGAATPRPTPTPTVAPTAMPAPTVAPTAMPAPTVAPTPTAPVTAPVAPPAAPEDEGGLPTWAIVLIIIVAVVLAVGGGLFAFVRGRR